MALHVEGGILRQQFFQLAFQPIQMGGALIDERIKTRGQLLKSAVKP